VEPLALAFYLRLGYVPAPWTIYRDVMKLRPGEWGVIDAGGLRTHRYWDLGAAGNERALTTAEAVEAIDAELERAVRARLMSEVPLGAFLSGGIDSSLVVGLMAEATGPGVRTVTVGFSGEPSETEAARLVAGHHRTNHAEYTVDPAVQPLMETIQRHFGEPFADSSAYPTWHLSRVARSSVTVALTGDGGDESFAGYDFRVWPHLRDARARRYFSGPAPRWLFQCLAATWPRRHDLPRPFRLGNLFRNLATEEDRAYYLDLCFTAPVLADALAPELAPEGRRVEEHVRGIYRSGRGEDPLQAMMRADASLYLPEDVLVKVDRMSMAHGLEVRSPLLSRRVVELAFTIPASLKVAGGVSKALLRKVAERHVPRELIALPKRGFHIPLDRWLRHDLRGAFEADVLAAGGAGVDGIDTRIVRRLWSEHQRGAFNHGHTLWMVWSLQAWLRAHRDRAAPAPPRPADLAHVA
jgi:asparagine synthase (glutamine-hydrolysing)